MTTLGMQDEYQVTLDAFRGPLDLLLYLIRRAEVDIERIPIHTITEQYFAFLKQIDHVDIDLAGEFLVMAATLIELKARSISPIPRREGAEGEEGTAAEGDGSSEPTLDPRHELVQQLLAYQRYRDAGAILLERRDAFAQRWPVGRRRVRGPVVGGAAEGDEDEEGAEPFELELEDAHVLDLFEAYERIVEAIDMSRMGDHRVEYDDTPIELHKADLMDRLGRLPVHRMTLQQAFTGRKRGEMIGLFLAMLELARQRQLVVRQDALDDPITIEINEDPEPEVFDDDDDAVGAETAADAEAPSADPG